MIHCVDWEGILVFLSQLLNTWSVFRNHCFFFFLIQKHIFFYQKTGGETFGVHWETVTGCVSSSPASCQSDRPPAVQPLCWAFISAIAMILLLCYTVSVCRNLCCMSRLCMHVESVWEKETLFMSVNFNELFVLVITHKIQTITQHPDFNTRSILAFKDR